jgi:hypothetical protein
MFAMERDAEIEQIDRELAILQARYELYRRSAGIAKVFFMILAPILAVAGLGFAVKLFLLDVLYGLFFIGGLLVLLLSIAWYIKSANLRWIDLACPRIRGILNPYFYYPDANRAVQPRSDAELLEWQIANRQERLSELAATLPGANRPD